MSSKIVVFFLTLFLLFAGTAILFVTAVQAQNQPAPGEEAQSEKLNALSEEVKIEHLITVVENMPEGTKFIRNGTEYDGARAASHLRLKYRNAKRHAKTAALFIENLASKSSMSGEEYRIKLADGKIISAREFFTEELGKLEDSAVVQ